MRQEIPTFLRATAEHCDGAVAFDAPQMDEFRDIGRTLTYGTATTFQSGPVQWARTELPLR